MDMTTEYGHRPQNMDTGHRIWTSATEYGHRPQNMDFGTEYGHRHRPQNMNTGHRIWTPATEYRHRPQNMDTGHRIWTPATEYEHRPQNMNTGHRIWTPATEYGHRPQNMDTVKNNVQLVGSRAKSLLTENRRATRVGSTYPGVQVWELAVERHLQSYRQTGSRLQPPTCIHVPGRPVWGVEPHMAYSRTASRRTQMEKIALVNVAQCWQAIADEWTKWLVNWS